MCLRTLTLNYSFPSKKASDGHRQPRRRVSWTWRFSFTFIFMVHGLIIFPASAAPALPTTGNGNELENNRINKSVEAPAFFYRNNGPASWYALFMDCGGNEQSPINIDTTSSIRVRHPHLFWWNYNLKPKKLTLSNNGHTAMLSGEWLSQDLTPYFWISTGTNEENFVLDQIHFHWGLKDDRGSEHLINNHGFPLELHAVHYDRKFKNMQEALALNRGIRVIAIFFMMSEARNPALDNIVSGLSMIKEPLTSTEIESFEFGKLLTRFSKAFISYNGSLTTPPCAEAVTWHIRLLPSTISLEQLEAFRRLRDHFGGSIAGNFRPVQPLNGRKILHIT